MSDQKTVLAQEEFYAAQATRQAAAEASRPCYLLLPALHIDGDRWCALYGDNIQDGLAGFGETPAKAMEDFDNNYNAQRAKRVDLQGDAEKPRRRYEFCLEIGADSRQALADALHSLTVNIERDDMASAGSWGSPNHGGTYTLNINKSVTHDSYVAALRAALDKKAGA